MERLFGLVNPELAMMGFELIELDFSGSSLRLTIDRPGGVSMDDCVAVTRRISLLLDAEDPIEGSYRLEVSSPGLTRRLKAPREFEYFSGRKVKVKTSGGVVRGIIRGLKGDTVILDVDGSEVSMNMKDIVKANLDF
ncbi:MAG TPA: ribosome maturation factor RimP [Deltaproteobacteria bacterium]|nr:ribosome maturation factor RimP [Deltaproteobacteria bacterium]HPR53951.1 ribosome maturation factor RimP [Deltaproteobacteria bacterium]HXK46426.1 ribosome maturation factor RimP [Deltaproteobacteria bacterium]